MICIMTTHDGIMTQKHKPARVPFGTAARGLEKYQVSFSENRHDFLPQPLYFTPDAAQPYTLSVPVISIIHVARILTQVGFDEMT